MTVVDVDSAGASAVRNDRSGLRLSLENAFGENFDIWHLEGDSGLPIREPNLVTCLLDDEQYRRIIQPDAQPEIVELSDRCLLVLPIAGKKGIESIATGMFATAESNLLLRLAKQFIEKRTLQNRVLELGTENDSFVQQVTNNFEELVFLRSLAEYLEVTEVTDDVLKMAEGVLPLLNEFVHAECLMLLSGGGSLDECASDCGSWTVGQSTIRVGETLLDDRLCARLVRRYQAASSIQPVVRNNCHLSNEFVTLRGLKSFVLVPLTKTGAILGWLLAVNRIDPSLHADDGVQVNSNDHEFGSNEATLLSSTASILATHATNVELFQDKEQLLLDMVRALVHAIEAKDPYTCGHSERVALFSSRLGKEIGLSETDCQRLYLTGLLHDVGKIGVDDSTLQKPDRLTDEEFAAIKQHPDQGWVILHDLDQLRYVLPGVLYHHERWDGGGYPDGLAGDDIPRDGRILAVADAYDAMTSDRPYRQGMPSEKAVEILRGGANVQWDERFIDAFLGMMPEIRKIAENYQPRIQATRDGPQQSRDSNTVPFNTLPSAVSDNA